MRRTCTQIRDRLGAFVYGGLNQRARAAVEKHVADCPRCRDQVRVLQEERTSLRQFVADLDAEMGERLNRVRRRLESEPAVTRCEEPRRWYRFIPGHTMRVGAAAAVLLAGVVLLMHVNHGSIGLSTTALARVAEVVNSVPWVHLRTTVVMEGKTQHCESWASNPLQISASKDEDGRISWYEPTARRHAAYTSHRNMIVISYSSQTSTGNVINPSSPIDAFLKRHDEENATVTCERGQHEGIDADIYEANEYGGRDAQRYVRARHRLITDRKRHLILVSEQYVYGPDGALLNSNATLWDYPLDGPKSIYDIGAPMTARVLDFSPSPELLKVLDRYEANRDTFPDRYTALVQHSHFDPDAVSHMVDAVHVFRSDGVLKRADSLYIHPMDQRQFTAKCGDSFETLMNWWERRENSSVAVQQQSVCLYDKEYSYRTSTKPDGSWQPMRKRYFPARKDRQLLQFAGSWTVYGDAMAEFGYPLRLVGRFYTEPTKIAICQDDYAKDNGCISIELLYDGRIDRDAPGLRPTVGLPRRSLFYLDPNRDYFCRREEVRYAIDAPWPVDPNWLDGVSEDERRDTTVFFHKDGQRPDVLHGVRRATIVRDMAEYDRTDTGRWYPKKIITHCHAELYDGTAAKPQSTTIIYLKANPTFRDGTFDPNRLPK